MAKQCGPIYLEGTWDDLTFYKMDGEYYCRKKSRLTRDRVKKHPDFARTMAYANLLGIASKISSAIYSQLPKVWRQFWMYRSFTGEAMTMIEEGTALQDVYDYLWETYVEHWVLREKATGIRFEAGRTKYIKKAKRYKTRLRHKTGNEKCQRPNNTNQPWKRKGWKDGKIEKEEKQWQYMMKRDWVKKHNITGTWEQTEARWRIYLHTQPRAA